MKYFIVITLVLVTSVSTIFGQSNRLTSMILRYEKVTEFGFDEKSQNYIPTDTIEFSGAISVDPEKVFIKGYNQTPDKLLKIVEIQKEEGTNRDLYTCETNGQRYAVAISPDKRYLSQIGINAKFIYELKTNNNKTEQVEVIKLETNPDSKKIFVAQTIEVKPIFGNAENFEEGEKQLKEYLKSQIDKQKNLESGKCYISIVISKVGKVEDVKILYGKSDEFNLTALNIAENIPDWKPGQQKGKPVNSLYNLEIKK
ncbi:hypothetical protein G3O08_20455 [Cryomorpha ignava]|uniref:TonB C-terminal domain-containing protein n=1 Tax=Cryomorpha ignava TaxID=101383 RepID=A0A7K3WWG2_9FLAO|nr:energy transducer TonB [Cryomorpha ignava]NEN25866.1 hypothetical protein [Cryomorpha ignava]